MKKARGLLLLAFFIIGQRTNVEKLATDAVDLEALAEAEVDFTVVPKVEVFSRRRDKVEAINGAVVKLGAKVVTDEVTERHFIVKFYDAAVFGRDAFFEQCVKNGT